MNKIIDLNCAYLNKSIRTTEEYWQKIINIKHPSIKGHEKQVINTLANPDEIRKSIKDKDVYLYYKNSDKKYLCVIVKILNGEGFIITVYFTAKIKEGVVIWKK